MYLHASTSRMASELENVESLMTSVWFYSFNQIIDALMISGGRRKLYRDVVLLTDDRSLRLKAISKDMPVRTLPDFIKWAGLG